jgi:hypothetical protein
VLVSFLPAGHTSIPSFIAKSIEGISIHTKVLLEWRTSKRAPDSEQSVYIICSFQNVRMDVNINDVCGIR